MLATNAIDVSKYQEPAAIDWNALREAGIELAIVKATEGLFVDPKWIEHYRRAHEAGLPVAVYHFLSSADNGEHEAEHHLRVVGDQLAAHRSTFVLCDWENNAVTGAPAAPVTAVRNFLLTCDRNLGENRCAWYSYRDLANIHRPMLPWPLWLSDPNDNAEDWARYLGAFMVQTGETVGLAGHEFTLLTDSIFNRDTFALLTGEHTVITKQDAQTIVMELAAALGLPVDLDANNQPVWPIKVQLFESEGPSGAGIYKPYPLGAVGPYTHEEAKRGKLAAQTAVTNSARGADNAGMASQLAAKLVETMTAGSVGLTPAQLATAVLEALKQVAPFMRITIAGPQ